MNDDTGKSPQIVSIGWGKMKIENLGSGKDFKLWPGGGRPWDWSETGTAHSPGVQIEDVRELLEKGCEVIVLTKGIFSRLKIQPETISFLEENGVEVVVTDTKRGVQMYNAHSARDRKVGGLFHSTC